MALSDDWGYPATILEMEQAKEIEALRSALNVLAGMIQGDIDAGMPVSDSRREALAKANAALGR